MNNLRSRYVDNIIYHLKHIIFAYAHIQYFRFSHTFCKHFSFESMTAMKIGGANFEMKLCRYCRYPYLLADNTVQLKPV